MIRTVNNGTQLIQAAIDAANFPITKIVVDNDSGVITVPAGVTVPKKLKATSKQLEIDLQGHTIIAGGSMEYVIGREQPIDNNESINMMQSQRFVIKNGLIDCKLMAGTGVLMRSTYHDNINGVTVINGLNGGIIEQFGMNAKIEQCEVRNTMGIGIGLMRGMHPGSGFNNSGSNSSRILQSRVFPKDGQMACFAASATGSVIMDGAIVDAARDQSPQRGYWIFNEGSTTAKNVTIENWWGETVTDLAMFDLNLNGGYCRISGGFPQYGGTLVKAIGINYAELFLDMTGFIPGTTKFQTQPGGVVWSFRDNNTSFDFANPANWVGGVLPQKWFIERFGSSKDREFRVPGGFKLNGSNIINQTTLDTILAGYVKKP